MRKEIKTRVLVTFIFCYFVSNSFAQRIELTWSPNPEPDIKYYAIYRDTVNAPSIEIAQVPATETAYTDYDITVGKTYYYRIAGVDSADNFSELSDEIEVRTDVTTSVDPSLDGIPEQFQLSQNYPNPFNPETNFTYFVADKGQVSLAIYDLIGRRVRMLLQNESKGVGRYSIRWDGKDEFGNRVATGIYFARMVAGSFSQIRKVVLQK